METILNSIFEKDIPQQFHDRPMIEELIRSYTIQLEELKQVFYDLDNKTDIDTAEGSVLDDVGSIPVLSRKEAGLLAGIGVEDPVMSDERYRKFLKYKVLENTNKCTYHDLMSGIDLLWKYNKLHYIEDIRYPATIIFETDKIGIDDIETMEFYANLCIRASGVGVLLRKLYYIFCGNNIVLNVPMLTMRSDVDLKQNPLYLDGTWDLDGTYDLTGYKDGGAKDFYSNLFTLLSDFSNNESLESRYSLQNSIQTQNDIDTKINFLSIEKDEIGIKVTSEFHADYIEKVENRLGLVIENNLWYLDGKVMLDGTRLLDAEIYVCEL